MSLSLEKLPPEIIGIIADYCVEYDIQQGKNEETGTLLKLRATCRSIKAGTHDSWLYSYFNDRYLDLCPAKLKELKAMAACPELARAVKVLIVRCEDDTKVFQQDQQGNPQFLELIKLSCLTTLAMQHLQNLEAINFQISKVDAREFPTTNGTRRAVECSKTVSLVLSIVETCGLCPTAISNVVWQAGTDLGFTDISSMPQLPVLLSGLTSLELQCPGLLARAVNGNNFAQELSRSLNLMQSLTQLCLVDEYRNGSVMHELCMDVYLPSLDTIWLDNIKCRIHEMTTFLRKHTRTLDVCAICNIVPMEEDGEDRYRDLLKTLRDSFHLSTLRVGILWGPGGSRFQFPAVEQVFCGDENEDGFVEVYFGDTTMSGQQQIEKGVSDMLSWVILTPPPPPRPV